MYTSRIAWVESIFIKFSIGPLFLKYTQSEKGLRGTAFPPPAQPFAALSGLKLFVYAVVRSLFRVDIMRMALAGAVAAEILTKRLFS